MKTKTWIFIFLGLLAVCAAALLALRLNGDSAQTAELWVDGALDQTVDLSQDQTLVIETERGSNTVVVRGGEIFVTEATCPDGVCVAHGAARAHNPIVCLPNRLVIQLTGDDGADAVAR